MDSWWQHLKLIPSLDEKSDEKCLEMYVTCAQALKSSGKAKAYGEAYLYERLVKNMDGFSNLNELTIMRHTNNGIESFDSVSEKCPSLKRLYMSAFADPNRSIIFSNNGLINLNNQSKVRYRIY